MIKFLFQRLVLAAISVLGVSTIVFFSLRLIPGDPAFLIAGMDARPDIVDQIRSDYGLDKPLPIQYAIWLNRMMHGDWGRSIYLRISVLDEVLLRFKNSLILTIPAVVLATVVGGGLGFLSGIYRGSFFDRITLLFAVSGVSLPGFWLGLLLIIQFSVRLKLLPPQGMYSPTGGGFQDLATHLILPAITLSLPMIAIIARLTRTALLEVIQKQYILNARARGFTNSHIYFKEALPNMAAPVITVIGAQLGFLIGNSVIVEVVFSWPGLGSLLVNAVFNRDYPLIQGCVLVSALSIIISNLITDMLYGFFDPRIRDSQYG